MTEGLASIKMRPQQLALDLTHPESFAREDFVPAPANRAALNAVERWPDWAFPVLALVGPRDSGKSHLAAIWALQSGARIIAGRVLRAADVPAMMATGALVVEDVRPGAFDESALFHLLNFAREQSGFVLVTTEAAPASWHTSLPDLASRLRAIPTVGIGAPDEALRRAVAVKLLVDRQIEPDDAVLGLLLTRTERSLSGVRKAIARLDAESLRRKRPITKALAAEVFRSG